MKIEFFSTIAGVSELYPVLAAKNSIPAWVNSCREEYLNSNKQDIHVYRCPGIFELLGTGYVITAWHDINVEVTPDKILVSTPSQVLNQLSGKPTVTMQEQTAKFFPKRPWSQKHILKINTPWNILVPNNLKFLHIPVPFTDFFEFESVMGIHDPSIASDINIQGYINKTVGNFVIKAGTPICQLIPLTNVSTHHVCRDMNKRDELWFKKKKFFDSSSFILQRKKIKEAYFNFVKGNKWNF